MTRVALSIPSHTAKISKVEFDFPPTDGEISEAFIFRGGSEGGGEGDF